MRSAGTWAVRGVLAALVVAVLGCGSGDAASVEDALPLAEATTSSSSELEPTTTALPTTTTAPPPPPPPAAPPPAASAGPGDGCHPSYDPCVPVASDVDCAGGSGNGPAYVQRPVRVTGPDEYGLDADGNGVGCES
jgi:hypothetical protein